jgi:hypothetical protein
MLPTNILVEIFDLLIVQSLAQTLQLRLVCKYWNGVLCGDAIWGN